MAEPAAAAAVAAEEPPSVAEKFKRFVEKNALFKRGVGNFYAAHCAQFGQYITHISTRTRTRTRTRPRTPAYTYTYAYAYARARPCIHTHTHTPNCEVLSPYSTNLRQHAMTHTR